MMFTIIFSTPRFSVFELPQMAVSGLESRPLVRVTTAILESAFPVT
jgi:hypothetical protein